MFSGLSVPSFGGIPFSAGLVAGEERLELIPVRLHSETHRGKYANNGRQDHAARTGVKIGKRGRRESEQLDRSREAQELF